MARRRATFVVLFAAALAALPVALLVPGLSTGVLFLAPALVLLASLLSGNYVGEERLERLAAAVRPRPERRRPRAAHLPVPARRRVLMPRGGRLVATSLAVRPPPAVPMTR